MEAEHPDLVELRKQADEQAAGRTKDPIQQQTDDFYTGMEGLQSKRQETLMPSYAAFRDGRISGEKLNATRSEVMAAFSGEIDGLKQAFPLALTDRAAREIYYRENRIEIKAGHPDDIAAEGYYALQPQRDSEGVEDMSAWYDERDAYLEQFTPELQDYILHIYPNDRFTEKWMNDIEKQRTADMETLKPYYAVRDAEQRRQPAYAIAKTEIEKRGGIIATEAYIKTLPFTIPTHPEVQRLRQVLSVYRTVEKNIDVERLKLRETNKALNDAGIRWGKWKPLPPKPANPSGFIFPTPRPAPKLPPIPVGAGR